ncbi:MAG: hypothetical protein WBL05_05845 [Brooklawnia sp.]|uniref:hypothetical protein n=1 Tax=Brooklawnia sp. TaxID=2699740 RepID=UPI003C758630
MRAKDQHSGPAAGQSRVGIQQVGRAVQRDDGLARPRAAVHEQRAVGVGSDDGVLVGRDRAEDVLHPGGAGLGQAGQQRRVTIGGEPAGATRCEELVPVVDDLASCPAVSAPAGQTHRLSQGGREERSGGRGTPVHEQLPAGGVLDPDPPDIDDLAVGGDHPAQTHIEPVASQQPQARGQPLGLQVAFEQLLPGPGGSLPELVELPFQVGGHLVQGRSHGCEVGLVGPGQIVACLGGQTGGQVEHGRRRQRVSFTTYDR